MKSVFIQVSTPPWNSGVTWLDLWGKTSSSKVLRTTTEYARPVGTPPCLWQKHGVDGGLGKEKEKKWGRRKELEREKEGAGNRGEGHMAEEADGPHQVASDCPVLLLTHFQGCPE